MQKDVLLLGKIFKSTVSILFKYALLVSINTWLTCSAEADNHTAQDADSQAPFSPVLDVPEVEEFNYNSTYFFIISDTQHWRFTGNPLDGDFISMAAPMYQYILRYADSFNEVGFPIDQSPEYVIHMVGDGQQRKLLLKDSMMAYDNVVAFLEPALITRRYQANFAWLREPAGCTVATGKITLPI